jgi:hypothetical protein
VPPAQPPPQPGRPHPSPRRRHPDHAPVVISNPAREGDSVGHGGCVLTRALVRGRGACACRDTHVRPKTAAATHPAGRAVGVRKLLSGAFV